MSTLGSRISSLRSNGNFYLYLKFKLISLGTKFFANNHYIYPIYIPIISRHIIMIFYNVKLGIYDIYIMHIMCISRISQVLFNLCQVSATYSISWFKIPCCTGRHGWKISFRPSIDTAWMIDKWSREAAGGLAAAGHLARGLAVTGDFT